MVLKGARQKRLLLALNGTDTIKNRSENLLLEINRRSQQRRDLLTHAVAALTALVR
jgi:hypothetical protein